MTRHMTTGSREHYHLYKMKHIKLRTIVVSNNKKVKQCKQDKQNLQSSAYWLPAILSNLLQHHEPVRSLRSSSSHYLSVPRHNLKFGSRAFRSSAPIVSLPISIRESQSLPTFRRHLKTFCFQSAYSLSAVHLP